MKELQLLEDKQLRDGNISRIEVLDKVGGLLLLSNTEVATTEMVAKFYGVGIEAIQSLYKRNCDEFINDGIASKSKAEIIELLNVLPEQLTNMQGKSIVKLDDEDIIIPNRGMKLFSKRAILRTGMLLIDSEVAKEIRTRLLDIIQDVSVDSPVTILNVLNEMSEEKQIMFEVIEAQCNGDLDGVILAQTKLHALKNKRIADLEHTNELITTNALTINDSRDVINRIIRNIAVSRYSARFSNCWNEFYSKINYKLGINIKARDKKKYQSYLDVLTDEEVIKVESIARCWAIDIGLDLDSLLKI